MTIGIHRALNPKFEIFAKNEYFFNYLKMYSHKIRLRPRLKFSFVVYDVICDV